jgi:microcystin-dependent protein
MLHQHTGATAVDGSHTHTYAVRENMNAGGSSGEAMISNATGTADVRSTTADTGTHNHAFTTNFFSGETGTNAWGNDGFGNFQPGLSVNFIIRVQ